MYNTIHLTEFYLHNFINELKSKVIYKFPIDLAHGISSSMQLESKSSIQLFMNQWIFAPRFKENVHQLNHTKFNHLDMYQHLFKSSGNSRIKDFK